MYYINPIDLIGNTNIKLIIKPQIGLTIILDNGIF